MAHALGHRVALSGSTAVAALVTAAPHVHAHRPPGLAGQILFQCPTGNAAKAVMSWAASCSIASTRGNWRAEHASDDAELLLDLRRAGLGEDGADGRGDHLRRALGHLS